MPLKLFRLKLAIYTLPVTSLAKGILQKVNTLPTVLTVILRRNPLLPQKLVPAHPPEHPTLPPTP